MRSIWKYRPAVLEQQIQITTHWGSRLLSVQFQDGLLTFWFLVDTDLPEHNRFFWVYGTGWEIEEDLSLLHHVATIQREDMALVWHVFEDMQQIIGQG